MGELAVEHLTVAYNTTSGDKFVACQDLSLTIRDGEFVTIIGPSGCGKSTLLHSMGGLIAPTSGTVLHDGQPVVRPDPHVAAFVFQDYSLFPWKSVVDNVAMGMRFAGERRRTATRKAADALRFVGIGSFAHSYPRMLSGGMQQRVAIARALVLKPMVLLMDEPFGALDEMTRRNLGAEMSALLSETGRSVALITHSLDEAVFWGDRIVIMSPRPGRIVREITVDAPRPRTTEFMTSSAFQDIRVELFGEITELVAAADSERNAEAERNADDLVEGRTP